MKHIFVVAALFILINSCTKKEDLPETFLGVKDISSFSVLSGKDTIKMNISNGIIEGLKKDTGGKHTIVALFTFNGKKVRIGQVSQVSGVTANDFTDSLNYVVEAFDGSSATYTVKLRSFTGLPILFITSPPIISKDVYVDATMIFNGNSDYLNGNYGLQIKGRGSSTWFGPKKSYKLKFTDKQKLFGYPSDKEWAILSNVYDKSLLRNDVGFELSERVGLAWTPKRKFVEIFLDGVYNGNYLLTETVKSGKDRVNIDLKNGGYLLEVNTKPEEGDPRINIQTQFSWLTPFDVKEAEVSTESITADLKNILTKIEGYQFNPDSGYQKFFDLDSYVKWYIVNEIMLNNDAQFFASVFLQKDNASAKLKMSAVWDFDLSSGNVAYATEEQKLPENIYRLRYSPFVGDIYNDPAFQAALKATWNENKAKIFSIVDYIDANIKRLEPSTTANYKLWDVNAWYANSWQLPGSYAAEAKFFRDWMSKRITWMDKDINK